jgi:CheY-like chemotaxis protein
MDCQLPVMDGYEACRRIRALEASGRVRSSLGKALRILALTASATVEDQERARLAGMDDHVPKPIEAGRLLAVLSDTPSSQSERVRRSVTRASWSVPPEEEEPPTRSGKEPEGPAVDLGPALARLGGNDALLARIIVQFRSELEAGRRQLREAVEKRDAAVVSYAGHRLRGQAAALDAEVLVQVLQSIERLAVVSRWVEADLALRAVEREADRVMSALEGR